MIEEERRESFLARWSRRKLAPEDTEIGDGSRGPADATDGAPTSRTDREIEESDISSLPPVDSLGADSDYTCFMDHGVPKATRIAALRRAWTTDPMIRDHKTPADYDWDFNASGYGVLRSTDQPAEIARRLFRHLSPAGVETAEAPVACEAPDEACSPEDPDGETV